MPSAFLMLKKNKQANAEKLQKTIHDATQRGGKSSKDERFYYPERDAQGVGSAVIRFLPEKDTPAPFVRVYSHGFKGPGGKWLIEDCPTTLGRDHSCPVCEANSEAYNKGKDYYKEHASFRKRKTKFITNILVVSDPKTPDNEGKVFLFSFGTKIMDMVSSAMNPEFEDETPMNAFDLDEGANFKLKIVKKDGNTNYDKSSFDAPSAVADGDAGEQEVIWNSQYDLGPFIDPKNFLTYEEMEKKFTSVMNGTASKKRAGEDEGEDDNQEDKPAAASKTDKFRKKEPKSAPAEKVGKSKSASEETSESSDVDPLAYFESMLQPE